MEFAFSQLNGEYLSLIQAPYIENDKQINFGVVYALAKAETVRPKMTPEQKLRKENEFDLTFAGMADYKSEEELKVLTLTDYIKAILSYSVVILVS